MLLVGRGLGCHSVTWADRDFPPLACVSQDCLGPRSQLTAEGRGGGPSRAGLGEAPHVLALTGGDLVPWPCPAAGQAGTWNQLWAPEGKEKGLLAGC